MDAIATCVTASPTCASSIFVTRWSREIARASRARASCVLSSVGTSAEVSWNSAGIGSHDAGSGNTLCSSGCGERGVLPRSPHHLADVVGVRVSGPRVAQTGLADDPDADASGLGELEPLDLASERARFGPTGLFGVRLDGLPGLGRLDGDPAEVGEVRHRFLRP